MNNRLPVYYLTFGMFQPKYITKKLVKHYILTRVALEQSSGHNKAAMRCKFMSC